MTALDVPPGSALEPGHSSRSGFYNLEAEAALIGAMLMSAEARKLAIEKCDASDFSARHGAIFGAITWLLGEAQPIDAMTVTSHLEASGELDRVGGRPYVLELQAGYGSTRNVEAYADVVHGRAKDRRAHTAAGELQRTLAAGADRNAAISELLAILDDRDEKSSLVNMAGGLDMFLDRIETGPPKGTVPTGLVDLDRLLNGGLHPGAFSIIGARPSMGKTVFGLHLAVNAARAGISTLFVSIEMGVLELMMRIIAAEAGINLSVLLSAEGSDALSDGEWQKLSHAVGTVGSLPMQFLDQSNPTVPQIRSIVQHQAVLNPDQRFGLVVVDYLQLMAPSSSGRYESRQQDVSEMSRGLKVMARDLELSVVSLSQLSRNLESRSDKRPILSDLRESGSLEQDADNVFFLYRNEVYEPGVEPGIMEIITAKQRNGPTGTVRASFLGERTAIRNLARLDGPPPGRG